MYLRKILAISFLICASLPALNSLSAETTVAEMQVKKEKLLVPEKIEKNNFEFGSYYEYGWTHLNGRVGTWRLSSNYLGYNFDNGLSPYIDVEAWDRYHVQNQMINAGAYLKFQDFSYLRLETGFGNDITYLAKNQVLTEYQHRAHKNLFWQTGYRFLNYTDNDVYIFYPGLIYYFGNNYFSVSYDASRTEGRGWAQWGTLKAFFAINNRLDAWMGTAIGQRLYDINPVSVNKQYGFINFIGFDYRLYKELRLKLGFAYSKEGGNFTKRDLDFGISMKF